MFIYVANLSCFPKAILEVGRGAWSVIEIQQVGGGNAGKAAQPGGGTAPGRNPSPRAFGDGPAGQGSLEEGGLISPAPLLPCSVEVTWPQGGLPSLFFQVPPGFLLFPVGGLSHPELLAAFESLGLT